MSTWPPRPIGTSTRDVVNIPAGEVVTLEFRVEGVVATPGEVVTWTQPLAIEVTTDASG